MSHKNVFDNDTDINCMAAMDIQFAYNLERLLYYTSDNTHIVREIMIAVDDQFSFKPNATGEEISSFLYFSFFHHFFIFNYVWYTMRWEDNNIRYNIWLKQLTLKEGIIMESYLIHN